MSKTATALLYVLFAALCLVVFARPTAATDHGGPTLDFVLRDGDLIFQSSQSGQSQAIQLATGSKYSHMGMIYKVGAEYFVFEAIQPVKLTKLSDWVKRGTGGHYVVKRLKNADEILTAANIEKTKAYADRFRGKDYDLYFEWSDDRIYCSELVWKIYKQALNIEIGTLQELGSFDLTSDVVKATMKKRYVDKVPLHEKVISPAAMFNSPKLLTVVDK